MLCHVTVEPSEHEDPVSKAFLETSAVLVLAPLMAAVARDPDATNEARSLTVVTVRVLYRVIG